jgi:hypothetical protein
MKRNARNGVAEDQLGVVSRPQTIASAASNPRSASQVISSSNLSLRAVRPPRRRHGDGSAGNRTARRSTTKSTELARITTMSFPPRRIGATVAARPHG